MLPTASLAAAFVSSRQAAHAGPSGALRVFFQKGEPILLAVRQNRALETLLNPAGHRRAVDRVPVRPTDAGGDARRRRRSGRVGRYAGVRTLAKWTDITEQNSFFMARRAYVEANEPVAAIFLVRSGVFLIGRVRSVDPHLLEMARAYGMAPHAVLRRVVLPGALPSILVGLRYDLGIMC